MLAAAGLDASSWQRRFQQPACIYENDTASPDAGGVEPPEHRYHAPVNYTAIAHTWCTLLDTFLYATDTEYR